MRVYCIALKNVAKNCELVSSTIQKDIINAISLEVVSTVFKDIEDFLISILVDEYRAISLKEQMAIVVRYMDKRGHVLERIVGIEHIGNTCVKSLKDVIDNFLARHGLSTSILQGQVYDGANNMRGQFNGLKALILRENETAFYVHYFSRQLQLALAVALAKKNVEVKDLFHWVTSLVNVVGASVKHKAFLRAKQAKQIFEALNNFKISSGQWRNQETCLKRACDTQWGLHYDTLINLIIMFPSMLKLLKMKGDDGLSDKQIDANVLL